MSRQTLANYQVWCGDEGIDPKPTFIDHTNAKDAALTYSASRWRNEFWARRLHTCRQDRESGWRTWTVVSLGQGRFRITENRSKAVAA